MSQPDTAAVTVVVPGDLNSRTGGYEYDRRIIAGLRQRGWTVNVALLDDSFPFPTAAARVEAARVLAAIPDHATVLVDGLALGALPDEAAHESARLDLVALVHHPLAAETGLDPDAVALLEASERRALERVRAVVVTSRATAAALAHYGVGADRIMVAEPGTDPAPLARGTSIHNPQSDICNLLCVATLTPRKGHELLFRALASLGDRRWHLICGGSLERDRALVARLRAQIAADGIADRIELVGDLDAAGLAVQYDRADVFVLPTHHEGYGMAVAEALARGLPVVSTATGGIRELVTDDAGIVVRPGDLGAFTAALARVLDERDLRERLAAGARRVRERLPTWGVAVGSLARVLSGGHHAGTPVPTPTPALRHRNSDTGTPTPGFSADWLALREPADAAARSARLARAIADAFPPDIQLPVLDLGAGTGANLRYLSPRLPLMQLWLLVDHDAALLARVAAGSQTPGYIETREHDLSVLTGVSADDLFDGRRLVTASALLDLVSADWIEALVARCRAAGASVLFALNYDGRIACKPHDEDDELIRDLVNRHQRTDKGFGPALGPTAADFVARALSDHGYRVDRERSDWVLAPASSELQRQLIDGWASAAVEMAPDLAMGITAWRSRRLAHLDAGRSHIVVGHEDVAGLER